MNTDERPAKKRCVWMRARAQSLTDNAEWRRRVNCEMGGLFGLGTALTLTVGSQAASVPVAPPRVGISSSDSSVTIYGASWCSACRSLEGKLDQRRIPFSVIDVDKNREAYNRARKASGMSSAIPLTHITQNGSTWVQGDDADAVERAYKGE